MSIVNKCDINGIPILSSDVDRLVIAYIYIRVMTHLEMFPCR